MLNVEKKDKNDENPLNNASDIIYGKAIDIIKEIKKNNQPSVGGNKKSKRNKKYKTLRKKSLHRRTRRQKKT